MGKRVVRIVELTVNRVPLCKDETNILRKSCEARVLSVIDHPALQKHTYIVKNVKVPHFSIVIQRYVNRPNNWESLER